MMEIDLGLNFEGGVEFGSVCFSEQHNAASLGAAGVNSGTAREILSECRTLYSSEAYFNEVAEDVHQSPTHKMAVYIQEAIGAFA